MKISEYSSKCGCCGEKIICKTVISRYQADAYLDGKPVSEKDLLDVSECPWCHYCAIDIEKPVTEEVRKLVQAEKFQNIMTSPDYDQKDMKYKAAAKLTYSTRERGILYLNSAWYLEIKGEKLAAKEMRKRAVENMTKTFSKEGVDEEEIISYIDCLRQLGQMREAMEQIEDVDYELRSMYSEDHIAIKILDMEKKLIAQSDAEPYKMSEV